MTRTLVAIFSIVIAGAYFLNSTLSNSGLHGRTLFNPLTGEVGMNLSIPALQKFSMTALMTHEMAHMMAVNGVMDFDVPIASAMLFVIQDHDGRKIPAEFAEQFSRGLNEENIEAVVDSMMKKYPSGAEENLDSHQDGAYLAGISKKLFGFNTDIATEMLYLRALSIGATHVDAVYLANHEEVFSFVQNFRLGAYYALDREAIDDFTKEFEFDEKSLELADKYEKYYDEKYRVSLRMNIDPNLKDYEFEIYLNSDNLQ